MSEIDNKALTIIANIIANSVSRCNDCEIQEYCKNIKDSDLCEHTWAEWIAEQLKEQKDVK